MSELRLQTAIPTADADQLLGALDGSGATLVDLRSPAEFEQDHLPGAVNVPLFDDVERAMIGTLYKRVSPEAAFARGREVTLAGVTDLVHGVADAAGWGVPAVDLRARVEQMTAGGLDQLEGVLVASSLEGPLPEGSVILHCWRGGLRSRSVVAFLRRLGFEKAYGLAGGYKGWRARVRAGLDSWQSRPTFVLRGWTGVGKTLVLRALERERPGWTVDLEGLAGHRSSILGMVGLRPRTQKAFETGLFQRLRGRPSGPCVLEGESRKIGDVILPERVWEALDGGVNLKLEAPLERRVQVLIADYLAEDENRGQLRAQLPFIETRLGPKRWNGELVALLDERRDAELVEVLLERYYDPLYAHSEKGRVYAATFDASDPQACARDLAGWIESA